MVEKIIEVNSIKDVFLNKDEYGKKPIRVKGLIVNISSNIASNNSVYSFCTLSDKESSIFVKVWNCNLADMGFTVGSLVAIVGKIDNYNGALQLVLRATDPTDRQASMVSMAPLTAEAGYSLKDFVKVPPLDLKEMFNQIKLYIEDFSNPELKAFASEFMEVHRKRFLHFPASHLVAFNYHGALLYKVYCICEEIIYRCSRPYLSSEMKLDKDLMITSAIVLDSGVFQSLNLINSEIKLLGISDGLTFKGETLPHEVLSCSLIDKVADPVNLSELAVDAVKHIVMSHHNLCHAKFIEAEIINQIVKGIEREMIYASYAEQLTANELGPRMPLLNAKLMRLELS